MIRNKYLTSLCSYEDKNTGINQLLELFKYKYKDFIDNLKEKPVDLDKCTEGEIDYYLQIHAIEVPEWLKDNGLTNF